MKLRQWLIKVLAGKMEVALNLTLKDGDIYFFGEHGAILNGCTFYNSGIVAPNVRYGGHVCD